MRADNASSFERVAWYNGCRIYVDIMTGKKLSTFYLANSIIGHFFHPEGWDGVKVVEGGIVILPCCKFHFIREHENLV